MSVIVPTLNCVHFFFDKKYREINYGTPEYLMQNYQILEERNLLSQGVEIFMLPNRLEDADQFSVTFCSKISKLKYKTVHIASFEQKFLVASSDILEKLKIMSIILQRFEVDTVIIHANHFKNKRPLIKDILNSFFPKINFCVENNGFDDEWGASVEGLKEIFTDFPEFTLCLDIAHVNDFEDKSIGDFIDDMLLASRIHQIHYSYSTILSKRDLYQEKGFPGYNPYHALFSVLEKTPSLKTKEMIRKYPIILEGVVPREDKELNYLKKEARTLE